MCIVRQARAKYMVIHELVCHGASVFAPRVLRPLLLFVMELAKTRPHGLKTG